MNNLPKRKQLRIKGYDYSTPGSYFITICVDTRKSILWNVGTSNSRPNLSPVGSLVETAILQIPSHYPMISVDKFCIMPDHVHMILSINTNAEGQQIDAPTMSRVIGHMKRWVSVKLGHSIWQKSFVDRIIRNERGYRAVWEYIENNPIKLDTAYDLPDFENM